LQQIPLLDTIVLFSWRVATWEIGGLGQATVNHRRRWLPIWPPCYDLWSFREVFYSFHPSNKFIRACYFRAAISPLEN